MGSDERTGSGVTTTTTSPTETTPTTNGAATRPKTAAKSPRAAAHRTAAAATPTSPVHRRRAERRPEMIAKRREERFRQYEQRKKQWFYTKIAAGVAGALIAVALGWGIWGWAQDRIDASKLDDVVAYEYSDSEQHVDVPPTYTETPPVGGPHNITLQNCGYYEQPVNNWNAVHSLEHGAVWITYQPDLPADQVAVLKELAETQDYILVSPYPGLPAPVVASSWNHQLQLQSATDELLEIFINEYKQNPDTTPEFGAACSGGTSDVAA
jgi:hypothetical protein